MKTQTKTFLSSSIGPVIVTQTHTLYMRFLSTHHKPAASFYKQSDNVADFRTETRPSLSEFTRTRLSQLLSTRVIIGGNEGLREGKGKGREGGFLSVFTRAQLHRKDFKQSAERKKLPAYYRIFR